MADLTGCPVIAPDGSMRGAAPHTGTTIVACCYEDGVVIGADSRVSTGTYVSNRASDKITPLWDNVYLLRSGSAADCQLVADYGEGLLRHVSHSLPIAEFAAHILEGARCSATALRQMLTGRLLLCLSQSATSVNSTSQRSERTRRCRRLPTWSCRCALNPTARQRPSCKHGNLSLSGLCKLIARMPLSLCC